MDFLRENLTISVEMDSSNGDYGSGPSVNTTVTVFLGDEKICSDDGYTSVPTN